MSGRANNERELACPRRAGKDLGGSGWPPETFWLVLVSSLLRGCGFTPELGNLKGIICRSELFPGGSEVKASACYAEDLASIPGSGRSPGEGNGNPLQYSCLENPIERGDWWTTVQGVVKSQTRLSGFTFTFHSHALEKEMATHSSVLAWRIPGTGEPGGLPSVGSHRVGHD